MPSLTVGTRTGGGMSMRQTSVTFRRAPKAKVEVVTRLRSIWDDSAGTEDADDVEDVVDLEDAEE